MVQGSQEAPRPRPLVDDATIQILRLLTLVTLCDLVLRRASNAIRGLRLAEESDLLRAFNDFCPQETTIKNLLIVAAGISTILLSLDFLRRGQTGARVLGVLGMAAAAWTIRWRLVAQEAPTLEPELALGMIIAVTLVIAPAWPLFSALVGAGLASLWIVLADRGIDEIAWIEQAAEVFISAGVFLAWPLTAAWTGRPGRVGASLAIVSGGAVALTCWLNPPAWRHVVVHVLDLHTAGLPTELLCGLLSSAVAGLVGLASSGPRGRGFAVALFVLLASARGREAELVAVRIAGAMAVAWAWMGAVDQNPPVTSFSSSSSSSSSSSVANGSNDPMSSSPPESPTSVN